MSEATRRSLSTNRKKRGVVRASITKLRSPVEELEAVSSPDTADQAKRLTTRLETLFEEFKVHHYSVIALLDEDGELAQEQETFDTQDEVVDRLTVRLDKLISSSDHSQFKVASNRLEHLEKGLSSIPLCHLLMRMMSVSFNSWRNSCQNSKRNFLTFAAACSH